MLRPAIGERFVAIGKVVNAGKMLTVCTGEVLAYKDGAFARDIDVLADDIIAQADIPERLLAANG